MVIVINHCKNYLCGLTNGCVCDCSDCESLKAADKKQQEVNSLTLAEIKRMLELIGQWMEKNTVNPNPYIWIQPIQPNTTIPWWNNPNVIPMTAPYIGDPIPGTTYTTCNNSSNLN